MKYTEKRPFKRRINLQFLKRSGQIAITKNKRKMKINALWRDRQRERERETDRQRERKTYPYYMNFFNKEKSNLIQEKIES